MGKPLLLRQFTAVLEGKSAWRGNCEGFCRQRELGAAVSQSRALVPVLVGIAGVTAVGSLAYFRRRAERGIQARAAHAEPVPASSPRPVQRESPDLRESMVVPRSPVPDPLTVVLDLDGVLRAETELEPEPTVRSSVARSAPASAPQSERSRCEGDLDIDLCNVADLRQEQDEDAFGYGEGLDPDIVAAGGWRRR